LTALFMVSQAIDSRRLVGIGAERVTDVSSTDFPGHYPDEDHAWNLGNFRKVRLSPSEELCFV
jgi:DNA-directed RNA polymerases I and III subunit RPAC1